MELHGPLNQQSVVAFGAIYKCPLIQLSSLFVAFAATVSCRYGHNKKGTGISKNLAQ
jgi:hypothetical protein